MKKIYSIITLLLLLSVININAQNVTVTGAVSGNGSYPDLGSAFTAINGGVQTGATIAVSIIANTTEAASAVLNAGVWTSLTISPSGGAARTISGSFVGHLVDLNGASNVTIDGLNTGGNSLTLSTTALGASTAIRFTSDASTNTITRTTLLGSGDASFGVIYFGLGTLTGNDNNNINNCNIGASGTFPLNGIYSFGNTTVGIENSGNTINANNIFDFFNAGAASVGLNINSGNTSWTISNNKLYQTATKTYTAGSTHSGILVSSGNGYTITSNTIGFSSAAGTGVYTMAGAFANRFIAINLAVGTASLTSVQSNIISAISLSTTSGAATTNGVLCGINCTSGSVNIGNISANTIGATSGVGSLTVTSTTTQALVVGIHCSTTGAINIAGNNIGSLNSSSPTAAVAGAITGINISGIPSALSITNNSIGNATANNMSAGINPTTTGSSIVSGINLSGAIAVASTITGNTIQNLTSFGTGTAGFVRGIWTGTAGTSAFTISNNIVNNLNTNNANVSFANGQLGTMGIFLGMGTNSLLNGNLVTNINNINTGATAPSVAGMSHAVGTNSTFSNNQIYGITNASTSVSATLPGAVFGIFLRGGAGNFTAFNNMISLGTGQTTNTSFVGIGVYSGGVAPTVTQVFHNTIFIGGAASAGAQPSICFYRGNFSATAVTFPVDVRNNIFDNTRTGGTGAHFAIANNFGATASVTGWGANASNNNVLNSANAATVGYWTTNQTIAAWRTSSAGDGASFSGIPVTYINSANNLHLNFGVTPTPIESNGQTIALVLTDIDGQLRPGPTGSVNGGATAPDLGADEIDAVGLDLTPPVITYTPLLNTNLTTNRNISVTITDVTGVATGGLAPRIYFNKNAGAYFSTQLSLTSGNINNGVWTATIDNTLMGGVVLTDVIRYFVVAQDAAGTPNLSANPSAGFVGTNVNTVTTPPTTPSQYLIVPTLNGTINVGSTETYTSLTNAGGVFELINNSEVNGNITVNITSDLVAELGTNALNAFVSPFTILIRPSGAARIVTGSTASNALIRLNGASRVTIDGSLSGGTDRSLTIENTNTTGPQVVRFGSIGAAAITANTLRNCIIRNGTTTSSAVVVLDNAGTSGTFNNITIQNNDIQRAFIGIFTNATLLAGNGANLLITQNKLDNTGANAIRLVGVYVQGADGATVSQNTIGNFNAADGENDLGIWLATGTVNTTVSGNTVSNLGMSLTTAFAPIGIRESSGAAASGNIFTGNTVTGITTGGTVAVSGIANSSSGTIIERNNIQGIINTNASTYGAYGINTTAGNNVIIRNNFVSNITGDMTGGGAFDATFGIVGLRIAAGTGHQIYNNSVNLYGLRTGTATASLLTAAIAVVSTASTGMDIRNNIFANNITGGTTSIANVSVFLPSGGTSAMNLTWNNNQYYYGVDVATQGVGQAGTTPGTNFYTTLPGQLAYTSTLSAGGTNDNASQGFTTAVPFVSATDLHLVPSVSCVTTGKGVNIPSVTIDIDGNSRNTLPFIGAHEGYEPAAAATTLFSTTPGTTNRTYLINGTTDYLFNCNLVNRITPSGAAPIAGLVNSKVTIDATVQSIGGKTYVQRHFDITPVNNQSSATATVTLFVLQSEFTTYNLNNGVEPDLPSAPGDAAGIANLRLTKYSGNGTAPGNYVPGVASLINPNDANIIWNATNNWWEITFDVVGFSGFYIHGSSSVLPIAVEYFTARKSGSNHQLDWKVSCSNAVSATLTLERSNDGRRFNSIYSTTATAARCQQPFDYMDANPLAGINYYRLKMVDSDGKVTYSSIVALLNATKGFELISIAPNPVIANATLTITSAKAGKLEIVISDIAGRLVTKQSNVVIAGSNPINMNLTTLRFGTYSITVTNADGETKTTRFVKY